MARVSFAVADADNSSGFGIQEGHIEIIGAITKVHQYPPNKNSGDQGEAFPCVQLEFAKTDKDGNRTDEDTVKQEFGVGKLTKFHPGMANGSDDQDPTDQGDEVDTEGNCLFAIDENSKLHKTSKWMILVDSMEAKGFKSEVFANGYMPDLIGLKGHLVSVPGTLFPGSTSKKAPVNLIFDQITVFPYDKKKAAPKAAAKPAAAAGKPAAAAKPNPAPAPAPSTPAGGDVESIATGILQEFMAELAGQDATPRTKIQSSAATKLMRNKVAVKDHKPVVTLIKDTEWLTKKAEELGFAFDEDAGMLMFPAVD